MCVCVCVCVNESELNKANKPLFETIQIKLNVCSFADKVNVFETDNVRLFIDV